MNHGKNKPQVHIPFLSLACLSFIAGILLANYIKVPLFIVYTISLFCLAVLFYLSAKQKNCNYIIILIFFWVGLLRQTGFGAINSDDISYLVGLKLKKLALRGIVASQVEEGPFGKSFVFAVKNIKAKNLRSKASGKVYVRFNKRIGINYGDVLTIEGRMSGIKNEEYFNKGLVRKGIRCVLAVGRGDWITKHGSPGFSIIRLAVQTKEILKRRFGNIPSPGKDFLIAFILGDRFGLDQEIYSAFKQTGTVHVIAISGLHISIIIFMLIVFLKALRFKIKSRFVITVLFLLFYGFMTGMRPSIVRAVVMGIVFLLSFLVKREYHLYNSLALSAMIILFIWPWQIFDIGFQLSFISVWSIVFISPKILSILPKIKNKFLNFVWVSLVISLSTWLVTMPLVAYYFGIVSTVSLIANLFVVPFTPFILGGGFIYLLASFLAPIFINWLALSIEFIIDTLIFLVVIFRNLPFAYFYIDSFGLWVLWVYYGLLLLLFNGGNLIRLFRR